MPTKYVVKKGDCLFTIAKTHGFSDWRAIYDDPANAAFKKKRPNPNLIYPGDVLMLPDQTPKAFDIATGQQHTFRVKPLKMVLRVAVHDEEDKPLAGKKFSLELGSETIEGSTDGDGVVEQELASTVDRATLTVWKKGAGDGPRYLWNLEIGHLDPVEEESGARQRLDNLGFYCGDASAAASDDEAQAALAKAELALAVRAFQHQAGLDESGKLDDGTRSKLVEMHGA